LQRGSTPPPAQRGSNPPADTKVYLLSYFQHHVLTLRQDADAQVKSVDIAAELVMVRRYLCITSRLISSMSQDPALFALDPPRPAVDVEMPPGFMNPADAQVKTVDITAELVILRRCL
jgi:hypothetical protein